jgi:predicted naringenin-chalcone synthase
LLGRPEQKGQPVTQVWLNRIDTVVPSPDIHAAFVEFGRDTMVNWRKRALFDPMANLSDIQHRYVIIEPCPKPRDKVLDAVGFNRRGAFSSATARMALYKSHALDLAIYAVRRLDADPAAITHVIVASCTDFTGPGLDCQIISAAGLPDGTHRTIVGFIGCFAAINVLKLADQILRIDPRFRALMVKPELCSLHLQEDFHDAPKMPNFLSFAVDASAALFTAKPTGIAVGRFRAELIPWSHDLITSRIGEMHLSGQIPGRIRRWLSEHGPKLILPEPPVLSAVHAGGKSASVVGLHL